jgi:hypothetical protein
MEIIYETKSGKIVHGDNLDVLKDIEDSSVDSCISDFPYAIDFMGKNWDSSSNFYDWCKLRSDELMRVMKSGAYVAIFGSVKTNHRMKCAFEDSGYLITEEIDYLYLSGMPKSQDVGKMFDASGNPELANVYKDWKTAGLKPAHETITIFQKPLDGTYIQNIEKYGVGAMNIGACRVPISKEDIDMLNAKASKNPTTNYSDKDDKIYGKYAIDNQILRENNSFIAKKPANSKFVGIIVVNGLNLGIWNGRDGYLYLSEKYDPNTRDKFVFNYNDHTEGTIFTNVRENWYMHLLIRGYKQGWLMFESQKIKATAVSLLNKCIAV